MPHDLRNDKFTYQPLRRSTVESNLIRWKIVSTVPIYFHYISLQWIVGAVRFIPLPSYMIMRPTLLDIVQACRLQSRLNMNLISHVHLVTNPRALHP